MQTCSHLGICDPNLSTVRVDFPVQRVETTAADAQLVPTARVMRKALAQKHTGPDRGMLAKAEWERQLRARIEEKQREELDKATDEVPVELQRNEERQKALDAIQQDMNGGLLLCDRSHIPSLKEEDEDSSEEETKEQLKDSKVLVAVDSQFTTQASEDESKELLKAFLAKHGFADAHARKRRFLRSTYPLHMAAHEGNAAVVLALLAEGAQKEQKNSIGMTAEEVARRANKEGSHQKVLEALCAPPEMQ